MASEEMSFENVDDGGRMPGYTISLRLRRPNNKGCVDPNQTPPSAESTLFAKVLFHRTLQTRSTFALLFCPQCVL